VNRLKRLRESKGLNQVEIADILGISPQRYNMYERGKRSMPVEIAKDVADYFGVTLEEIFFDNELNVALSDDKSA